MADFEFENCQDAVIKVEENILGAVKQAVCTRENTYYEINEFLSDEPVCKIPDSRYKIKLKMVLGADNPFFENNCFNAIELILKNRTVKYSDCRVKKMESTVNSKGFVDMEIWIDAEKRDVV